MNRILTIEMHKIGETGIVAQIVHQDDCIERDCGHIWRCSETGIEFRSVSNPAYDSTEEILYVRGTLEEEDNQLFNMPKEHINRVLLAVHNLNKYLEKND